MANDSPDLTDSEFERANVSETRLSSVSPNWATIPHPGSSAQLGERA